MVPMEKLPVTSGSRKETTYRDNKLESFSINSYLNIFLCRLVYLFGRRILLPLSRTSHENGGRRKDSPRAKHVGDDTCEREKGASPKVVLTGVGRDGTSPTSSSFVRVTRTSEGHRKNTRYIYPVDESWGD